MRCRWYDEQAGQKWLVLLPKKWNKQVQYAWRWDPCELGVPGRARPPPSKPQFELIEPEDEYLATDDDMSDGEC